MPSAPAQKDPLRARYDDASVVDPSVAKIYRYTTWLVRDAGIALVLERA